jgi:hypothetical protein
MSFPHPLLEWPDDYKNVILGRYRLLAAPQWNEGGRFGVRAASEARRRFSGGALPSGTLSASRLPHFSFCLFNFSLSKRLKPTKGN